MGKMEDILRLAVLETTAASFVVTVCQVICQIVKEGALCFLCH